MSFYGWSIFLSGAAAMDAGKGVEGWAGRRAGGGLLAVKGSVSCQI